MRTVFCFVFDETGSVRKDSCELTVPLLEDETRETFQSDNVEGGGRYGLRRVESVGEDHSSCSIQRFSMSAEAMRRQFWTFLTYVLNRFMSNWGS